MVGPPKLPGGKYTRFSPNLYTVDPLINSIAYQRFGTEAAVRSANAAKPGA
jgi:hypothetical protein